MLKCGAAELVITPELGLMIPGQFQIKLASGVKDDLFAKAVVFDDGKTAIAMIVLDIIAVTADMTAAVRKRINEATGIPEKNILMSATHTHTGAPTGLQLYSSLPDDATVRNICLKAADAAVIAYRNMKDVKIGFGAAEEHDVGFNRRFIMKDGSARTNPGYNNPDIVKPAAPVDPSVNIIRIDCECGKPAAVVVNYACHPDVAGGYEYCADYPGEMSKVIKKVLGNDVVVLFFNGCCGDINHHDFTGKHPRPADEHYKKMGRILAGDVLAAREKIVYSSDIELGAESEVFTGKRRQPAAELIEWSKNTLANENSSKSDITYAESYIDLLENPILTADIEVQTFKIGELGISGYPSETFTEIGLAVKAGSPFKYNFTIELANGCVGYVATEKAYAEGGYETKLSKYTYMEAGTDKLISSTAVRLLNKL